MSKYPTIFIKIKLMSKARPRVTRNGTFMPKNYQLWRKEVAKQMKEQGLCRLSTLRLRCISRVLVRQEVMSITIWVHLLDTGNKIIWSDDRANIIQSASIDFTKAKESESYIQIRISDIGSKEARIDCIDRVMDQ